MCDHAKPKIAFITLVAICIEEKGLDILQAHTLLSQACSLDTLHIWDAVDQADDSV